MQPQNSGTQPLQPRPQTVVVALALEDPQRDAHIARVARDFAGPDAVLLLLHVHQIRQTNVLDYTYVEPPQRVAQELERANATLQSIAGEMAGPVEHDVTVGPPVEAVLKTTQTARLLVIGRTHLGFVNRLLEGDVETRLAHQASCPVLIVP